jgi:hypothetical protein
MPARFLSSDGSCIDDDDEAIRDLVFFVSYIHPKTFSHLHQLSSTLFPSRIVDPLHARTELT